MTKQPVTKKISRKRYSQVFKEGALGWLRRCVWPQQISAESQLYGWRMKARAQQIRSEVEQNRATEIARVKRQLAERDEELAIVKKAAAYVAKSRR